MNIQSIVVAGAGTMGSSMAQIFAGYYDNVVIYNHREVTLNKAKQRIQDNVQTLVQVGDDDADTGTALARGTLVYNGVGLFFVL